MVDYLVKDTKEVCVLPLDPEYLRHLTDESRMISASRGRQIEGRYPDEEALAGFLRTGWSRCLPKIEALIEKEASAGRQSVCVLSFEEGKVFVHVDAVWVAGDELKDPSLVTISANGELILRWVERYFRELWFKATVQLLTGTSIGSSRLSSTLDISW